MNKYVKSHKFLEEVLYKVRSIENTLKVLNQSKLNVEDKVERMSLLEEIKHEMISHHMVKESLVEVSAFTDKKSTSSQKLKLVERMHKSSSAVPIDLVKSLSQAKIECQNLWRLSQSENSSLERLKKRFADLVNLIREVASIKAQKLRCSKYDSLLADYGFDITEKIIKEIFPKIGRFFCQSVDKIIEKQKRDRKKAISLRKVAIKKQIELCSLCLKKMGISLYHYTSYYYPIDYKESDFCCSIFLLLRCSGHEIYRKYLVQNSINSPIAEHIIYETQGVFMESVIGKSIEFIEFIQPYIEEKFFIKGKTNAKFSSISNLYLTFNRINFSSHLKNADEFSLLAHVMLRTKLEQNIINGTLEVRDLHDKWLEGMKYYKIPIKAQNELDTYFQDEYWVSGTMGYFPIKIIALITAVQISSLLKENNYESLDAIIKGDFSLLIGWLSKNVCSATQYGLLDLLKKLTGKGLDVECCINYLSKKYNLSINNL